MDAQLEETIAAHLAAGDADAAVTAALHGLGPQIVGYLAAMLRDDEAAYEVFGAFSEQLWKSIGSFRGESTFTTWAYKLVMHSLARFYRDGFRKRAIPLSAAPGEPVADERSSTPPYKRSEIKDRFTQLRESLDPDDQTLLFLRIDQKLAWNEVAAIMSERGEPVEAPALRKRFERVKERLRELAAADGLLGDEEK